LSQEKGNIDYWTNYRFFGYKNTLKENTILKLIKIFRKESFLYLKIIKKD